MSAEFSLQRLLGRKEDHLTAMFALALELDAPLRRAFAATALARLPRPDGAPPDIAQIEIQRSFDEGRSCPDLTLTLTDGRLVLVENKIEAPETQGPHIAAPTEAADGPKKQPQLKRYLKLDGIAGLVFVRATRRAVEPEVLTDPRYLRPAGDAPHFLWRDFHPLLAGSEHPVARWLLGAFEACSFTPPTAEIGDLTDPERRENMAKLLEPTADLARGLGWTVGTGSISELYLAGHPSCPADLIWINPSTETLLVRLRPGRKEDEAQVRQAAESVARALPASSAPRVETSRVPQQQGRREVVDLIVPMAKLVAGAQSTSELEERFKNLIGTVLKAITP